MNSSFKHITAQTLKQWMEEERDMVIFDVLSPESYDLQHLPGAVNAPVGQSDFLEIVARHVEHKTTPIVVYCASESCQLSPKAAQKIAEAGYKEVYDFEAGLAGWEQAGYRFEDEAL